MILSKYEINKHNDCISNFFIPIEIVKYFNCIVVI